LRVTVSAVLGQLAAGRSVAQVLADYPYLEHADVLAALRYVVTAAARRRFLDDARQGAFASLTDPDERAEAWR